MRPPRVSVIYTETGEISQAPRPAKKKLTTDHTKKRRNKKLTTKGTKITKKEREFEAKFRDFRGLFSSVFSYNAYGARHYWES
jgi:hypothetical protein